MNFDELDWESNIEESDSIADYKSEESIESQVKEANLSFSDKALETFTAIRSAFLEKAPKAEAGAFSLEPGQPLSDLDLVVGFGLGASFNPDDLMDSPDEGSIHVYTSEPLTKVEVATYMASAFDAEAFSQGSVSYESIHTGEIDAFAHRMRMRPAPCGISCGHYKISAGTLGALAKGRSGNRPNRMLILSNNHVLADVNAGNIGDVILQPGAFDGGINPP